jgi:OPA family glycerol-3-phosphate transporter-like MFS transporter 3
LFDVGGVLGGIIAGRLIDRIGYRTIVLVPMLLLSIPIFLSFRMITADMFALFFLLVPCLGVLIAGCANLIVSLISTDLGRRPGLTSEAVSTICGIIDGTGSAGAGIG